MKTIWVNVVLPGGPAMYCGGGIIIDEFAV